MGKIIRTSGILLGIFLIIFCGCEEKKEIVGTVQPFEISRIILPAVVSSNSDNPFLFSAKVTHPEGITGISEVILLIADSLGASQLTYPMYYDGNTQNQGSGDVIAFDQVYSREIIGNQVGVANGHYQVRIRAVSSSDEVLESPAQIVEIFSNQPPEILNYSFPDSILTGMLSTTIFFTVADNDGLEDIRWVLLQGLVSGNPSPVFPDTVYNPGHNSAVFQTGVDSSYAVRRKGDYEMRFVAEDRGGEFSQPILKNVFFENTAPLVWDSQVPDTLVLPTASSGLLDTLITIRVKDGQSLLDVDAVYFFSLKPDTTLANNGNPLFMWDNGLPFLGDPNQLHYAGDKVAGDGIYSLTILLSDSALTGKYRFSFYALDRVVQESVVWVDSVWVRN